MKVAHTECMLACRLYIQLIRITTIRGFIRTPEALLWAESEGLSEEEGISSPGAED